MIPRSIGVYGGLGYKIFRKGGIELYILLTQATKDSYDLAKQSDDINLLNFHVLDIPPILINTNQFNRINQQLQSGIGPELKIPLVVISEEESNAIDAAVQTMDNMKGKIIQADGILCGV